MDGRKTDRYENPDSWKREDNWMFSEGETQFAAQNSIRILVTPLTDCLDIKLVDVSKDCKFILWVSCNFQHFSRICKTWKSEANFVRKNWMHPLLKSWEAFKWILRGKSVLICVSLVLTRNFSADLSLHSNCQCRLPFTRGYVSSIAGKESLQSFSILYNTLSSDPIFVPYATTGRFGATSSDHCEFSWWSLS
jgi:hypothetical protein